MDQRATLGHGGGPVSGRRQVRAALVPTMMLVAAASVRPGAAAPADPALHAGPSSGWVDTIKRDLAEREYELSWQAAPAAEGVEPSWQAPNRAQGFRTYFTQDGIRVVPRADGTLSWRWGLALVGYGSGAGALGAPRATLTPAGHRIDYHRGLIEEWYENTTRGLEQGFTLAGRPGPAGTDGRTGTGPDLLHLDLALWGDLLPRISEDGQAIDFTTASGAPALHYGQLRVTDGRGETLAARMEGYAGAAGPGIRIVVDARQAVYPVTVDPLATSAAWTAESDQANALFGWSVATAGDVNGDGFSDVVVGAYQYDNGQTDEGRAYVFLGSAAGLSLSPSWTAEGNFDFANFGYSVATAGDVNGDGFSDIVVGSIGYNPSGGLGGGAAFVYLGSATGLATTPAWTALSEGSPLDSFGTSVATAGDVNGDGYADVLVGDYTYTNGQSQEGKVYLYLGSVAGLAAAPAWTVESNHASDYLGISVATAGDVNADGYADVIVGAYGYNASGQSYLGRAYVYLGSASGLAATPVWTATGDQATDYFGHAVSTAGDVNGDGYADVIVGAYGYDNGQTDEGRAYVYLGSASGPAATPAWTAESDQASSQFGLTVATAGDVNGDGYADVLIGAAGYSNGESKEGRAYLYFGSATGLGASPGWTTESNQALAQLGVSVATAGDVNGDGFSDILVGAFTFSNGQTQEGRALLFMGAASGPAAAPAWTAESDLASADFGLSVASAGDVNGDGYSDVVVGAPYYYDGVAPGGGKVYLYLGSASGLATTPAWTAVGDAGALYFGLVVASAGDVNGDGYADILVSDPDFTNGQATEGRVYLYLGSPTGPAAFPIWTVEGDQAGALYGYTIASAGDVNGDGYADVIVGTPYWDDVFVDQGRAAVYLGSPGGLSPTPSWSTEGYLFYDHDGCSVSAGDFNGDGFADVVVGACGNTGGFSILGSAQVFLGSPAGLSTTAVMTAQGLQYGDGFGGAVSTAGDVNGDGFADIVVGAPYVDNGFSYAEGTVYLYLGAAGGPSAVPAWSSLVDPAFVYFGAAVATAGDVNGDGYADVVIGSTKYDGFLTDIGAALVYLGSSSGLSTLPAWTGTSAQSNDKFGASIASAGDIDGDGFADILVGAPTFDNGQTDEGRAYLYYGGSATGGFARNPRQIRLGTAAPVALGGRSDSTTTFRLRERGSTPAGRGNIRLLWEVKPLGTSFNGAGLGTSSVHDTGVPGLSGSVTNFSETAAGLSAGTFYHWRTRTVSADPFFPRSPWISLPGNTLTETKLRTSGCIDRDGDGYGEPNDPACLGPIPDCDDHNAGAWDIPGETGNLRFTSATTITWDPPAYAGAQVSGLVYDTLRTKVAGDFMSAVCVEAGDGPNTTATDGANPAVGQVFYYLTRARDACPQGVGTLGTDSNGNPRTGVTCP